MVGENKKECESNGKTSIAELPADQDKPENSLKTNNSAEEINLTKKITIDDKLKSGRKERNKSVTLVENVITKKRHYEIKKDGIQNKQKENKYLKGILKTKQSSPILTQPPLPLTPPSSPQILHKTEEIIQNPCPRYFGIRSYIDSFYYPPDDEVLNSGEYIQDDFEFVVEPGKRRWRNCWFKLGLWGGINLLLLGIIALLVGHLTHPRETVVARLDNLEILDKSAITFNSRLHLCKLAGITIFCIGGIILMLTFLISSYQQETTYYVMNTALVPDIFTRTQDYHQKILVSRIPLSGTLKPVQPR